MPAGLVGDLGDADTIESAARRELLEETGWQAEHIDLLMIGPTSSGLSNEMIAFVRARGLTRIDAGGGDDRSEEHTSELQSLMRISYAVFCLKKKNKHEII